jgi:general nucleoside transport system ATP-binding protein
VLFRSPAARLSPAGCQKLEILKLLWRSADVLILDEPTAMLSPPDAAALFQNLRQLTQTGKTVLLVTHRLREVVDYCDYVSVLRNGKKTGECDVADTDASRLANWIVGEDLKPRDAVSNVGAGPVVLSVQGLVVRGDRGDRAVEGLDLEVRAGELAGIAGVDGNGQTELIEAIAGLRPIEGGTVTLGGENVTGMPTSRRLRSGLRLIPADRHKFGLVEDWSVLDNSILGLQRFEPVCRRGLLSPRAQRQLAEHEIEAFQVKTDSVGSPAADLSGGNQQRLLVARALEQRPSVLLAMQPSRGLDVRGTMAVFEAIARASEEGTGTLVVSFDLDELLEHCDPIFVMREGRIVARLRGEEIERERIGRLMVGLESGVA